MVLIETPVFTSQIVDALSDDEYSAFQAFLVAHPDSGAVISGSGGLRKIRWSLPGRGKRGGMRVIYYHLTQEGQIWLLYLYAKNRQSNLSHAQLKLLRELMEENTQSTTAQTS